jgi:hypothetical protein
MSIDHTVGTTIPPSIPHPSPLSEAISCASAVRRLTSLGAPSNLLHAHRALSEPAAYAHAACISFQAALHATPSRVAHSQYPQDAFAAPIAATAATSGPTPLPPKSVRGDSSPAMLALSASSSPSNANNIALSYAQEQTLLTDAHSFLHALGWGLRMPTRVIADAALALRKYTALIPLQQPQSFIVQPLPDDAFTPGSSPAYSTSSGTASQSEIGSLLSGSPPHGLYLLATASLFLSCKAMDTPRKLNDVSNTIHPTAFLHCVPQIYMPN